MKHTIHTCKKKEAIYFFKTSLHTRNKHIIVKEIERKLSLKQASFKVKTNGWNIWKITSYHAVLVTIRSYFVCKRNYIENLQNLLR